MIKLIGKDINNKTVIVDCEDQNAVQRAKRLYVKSGVQLESYKKAIDQEAKRMLQGEDRPTPKYHF